VILKVILTIFIVLDTHSYDSLNVSELGRDQLILPYGHSVNRDAS
jgi:hypothetical protein